MRKQVLHPFHKIQHGIFQLMMVRQVVAYICIILIGTILLLLPISKNITEKIEKAEPEKPKIEIEFPEEYPEKKAPVEVPKSITEKIVGERKKSN